MAKMLFSAKLENLEAMMEFIRKTAIDQGFDTKQLNHIELASEEVLVNIINYAYPDRTGDIEITLTPQENKGLEIQVVDWGLAFDPLSVPEPDICVPPQERKIGGLGVYLLRKIMDEVYYKREDNRNILTFIKKI